MYRYTCRDVGVDCDFVTYAETPEEVKRGVFEHAGVVHKDMMDSLTPEQAAQLQQAVDKAIKQV
jgi:predicted small metal-binding protein